MDLFSKHSVNITSNPPKNNGGDPQNGPGPKNPPPPNLAVQIPPNFTSKISTEPLDVEPRGFPGNASDFGVKFSPPKTRGDYRSNFFSGKGLKTVGFFSQKLSNRSS